MQIGPLAAELGLNPKTLRHYEEIGLLPAPARSAAGYRLYTPEARDRLQFIAKAKGVGLSLEEIRDVLSLQREGAKPCEHVRTVIDRKLTAVDELLRRLVDFRQELLTLRSESAETMSAEACICGIIEQHQARPC